MEFKPLIGITYEFVFQLVNTFLVFFLLKKLLFKPVLGIIEAREKDIRENLAQGERAKKEGLSLKSEYEEKLNSAKEQGQEIIKQATLRAEQKENEIIVTAKQEANQLKEKASKDVEQEISNIALLAASKVIEKDIDSNKHKELIDNFIKEVGESK